MTVKKRISRNIIKSVKCKKHYVSEEDEKKNDELTKF